MHQLLVIPYRNSVSILAFICTFAFGLLFFGNLEQALNSRLSLVRSLIAHVSTNPDIGQNDFRALSREIIKQETGIRSIQLARNSIISHVFPLKSNENVLELNLLNLEGQSQSVQEAIEARDTILTGPVNLVQGGSAFISRTPVFVEDDNKRTGKPA